MNGYKSNYFNKNLLESMKNSLRQVVAENSNIGLMGAPGDFSKVSDLQLQNRMRQYKRGGLFAPKDIKQPKEYEEAKAELERRQAAKAAPAAAPVAAPAAAPAAAPTMPPMQTQPSPRQPDMSSTGPSMGDRLNPVPKMVNTAYDASRQSNIDRAERGRRERGMFELQSAGTVVDLKPSDIRPTGSAPATPPARPTPISVKPDELPSDTRAELLRQIDTPAARRRGTNKTTMNPGFSPIQ